MNKASELWLISGHQPCEWTIPVLFENSKEEFSTVELACYCTAMEREALDMVLALHGHKLEGKWRVSSHWVRHKCEGPKAGNAEDHKIWSKRKKEKLEYKRQTSPRDPDWTEFLDTLAEQSDTSRQKLEVEWATFCQHALNRLLVDRKSVDLGFIKLHPMPFRPNWKCVLLSRFKNLGKILSATNDERREVLMLESGLTEEMLCLDLLAYNVRENYCYLTVEVEHRRQWWKKVKESESARLIKQKAEGYASSFLNFVKRQIPIAQRVYVSFLSQIARVSPTTSETQSISNYHFVPNTGASTRRYNRPAIVSVDPVVPNRLPFHTGSSSARDLLETYGVLPEVPDLRSQNENVREGGADVQEPGDSTT